MCMFGRIMYEGYLKVRVQYSKLSQKTFYLHFVDAYYSIVVLETCHTILFVK